MLSLVQPMHHMKLSLINMLDRVQSIYFEDLDGIIRCLDAVAADPEVRVERVVNRLLHSYDAAATAGYRDVALNLRLEGTETAGLGLTMHVCEVQLVLISFAKIKVITLRSYLSLLDIQMLLLKSRSIYILVFGCAVRRRARALLNLEGPARRLNLGLIHQML